PTTREILRGGIPSPAVAADASVVDAVTNGYVPQSGSSSEPIACSSKKFLHNRRELGDVRFQLLVIIPILVAHGLVIERAAAQRRNDFIFQTELRMQSFVKRAADKIRETQTIVRKFVGERGTDAAPRGARRARAFGVFVQAVQNFVIRQ